MPPRHRYFGAFDSPIGRFWMAGGDSGLLLITRAETPDTLLARLERTGRSAVPDTTPLQEPMEWMRAYFAGDRPLAVPQLDLAGVPAFDARVYRAAIDISYGATASYGDVAAAAGSPRAARAAGGAMSRCPFFPVVPCHRVIHADGSIGGWGPDLWVKRWLLDHERRCQDRAVAGVDDVQRIAAGLPGAIGAEDGTWRVDGKLFAWPWMERVAAGRPRIANRDVLVVRVADESEKHSLIALDPSVFFTEPHYDGYAAILIRLGAVDLDLLEKLLTDSWRLRAPRRLLKADRAR